MPDSIHISLSSNAGEILRSLDTMPSWMQLAIARSMDKQNQLTVALIQRKYLSFPKDGPSVPIGCRVQSNRLRGSIRATPSRIENDSVVSTIGSNVIYAAAQEFGADYPARTIVPKNAKALRFQIGDRIIFAKSVNIPAHRTQGRHFVRQGLLDRLNQYRTATSAAIVDSWNKYGKS